MTDNNFRVLGAVASTPDGGFQLSLRKDTKSPFEPFLTWGPDENQNVYGFTPDE